MSLSLKMSAWKDIRSSERSRSIAFQKQHFKAGYVCAMSIDSFDYLEPYIQILTYRMISLSISDEWTYNSRLGAGELSCHLPHWGVWVRCLPPLCISFLWSEKIGYNSKITKHACGCLYQNLYFTKIVLYISLYTLCTIFMNYAQYWHIYVKEMYF